MMEKKILQLTICGIGANLELVKKAAAEASLVLARGSVAARWLLQIGITSLTQIAPEAGDVKEPVQLLKKVTDHTASPGFANILYVTPVFPVGIDLVAGALSSVAEEIIELPGIDPLSSLRKSGKADLDGAVQYIDALKISADHYPLFTPALPVLLQIANKRLGLEPLFASLDEVYPADTMVFYAASDTSSMDWHEIPLGSLPQISPVPTSLYLPPLPADSTLEGFMQIIARLRAPDGCPWDRKQTHTSLRTYLLEECYEALETLDNDDLPGLKEELGDLILQIALHAQIASENKEFTMTQVLQNINRKIVSRHPHVFGSVMVQNATDVVQNWEKLKQIEREESGKQEPGGLLDGIPAILPALSQAQSIQDRAARVGFDWPEISPVKDKVMEEMQEVDEAVSEKDRAHELGDLLFAVVNLVRWHQVDAESALRWTNMKFRKRFSYIEEQVRQSGKEISKMSLAELDALWEDAKEYDE